MPLKKPQQNLVKWTKEKWMTYDTYINKKSGKSKEVKSNGNKRYLPKNAWNLLNLSEIKGTNALKKKGNKKGKQYVKQTKAVAKKVSSIRNKKI